MNRPHSTSPGTAGFSLAELIIVLVILGIIAALGLPSLQGMVGRQRLDSVTRQLTQDIAYARMEAVRSAQQTRVVLEPAGYRVYRGAEDAPLRRLDLATEHPGVALSATSLAFNSRGLLQPGETVNLEVIHGERTRAIQVLPTGRVYHAP